MHSVESGNTENKLINIPETINKDMVTLSVRDYGAGIADSIKDKLFKPFVTSKKDGLGIGLSISQSIIHDHQGKIWAENKSDGGAEFSFSLNIQRWQLKNVKYLLLTMTNLCDAASHVTEFSRIHC